MTVLKTLHIHSTIFEHLLGTRILCAEDMQTVPDLQFFILITVQSYTHLEDTILQI